MRSHRNKINFHFFKFLSFGQVLYSKNVSDSALRVGKILGNKMNSFFYTTRRSKSDIVFLNEPTLLIANSTIFCLRNFCIFYKKFKDLLNWLVYDFCI